MRLVALKESEFEARRPWSRLIAVAVLTTLLGGCSTMDAVGNGVVDAASAMNPLNWFDDDDDKVASKEGGTTETSDKSGKDKKNPEAQTLRQSDAKRKSRGGKAPSTMLYGDNRWDKSYPKLGDIPDRPTSDAAVKRRIEHKKLAQGLVADSKNAQYTEQVLKARSGVTPPPPAASPTTPVAAKKVSAPSVRPPAAAPSAASRITPPPVAPPATPTATPAVAARNTPPPAPAVVRAPIPQATPAVATRSTRPPAVPVAPPSVAPAAQRIAPPAPPPQLASAPPSTGRQAQVPAPAVIPPPPPPSAYGVASTPQFATPVGLPQPNAAPPSPPTRNFSPPPVPPAYTATPARSAPQPRTVAPPPQVAAVPANRVTASRAPANGRAQYGRQQSVQVATIYFRNGSSRLGARDRTVVRDVVAMFHETGGAIRIVGHSSGIAASQGSGQSKFANFKVSLDRANAVAAELIRRGVPAEYIDVSAHGAENPVYAEYSATGEAGNRRAEVFLDYAGG
ncbi:MAG TPA: hypothetical protein DCS82_08870, partial [Rhodospirillaceae bacterium]|nr:hypothetical protein [Rhodospirillaceae bacterium]